jgi:propanol-preferring alcohol dehydrogenase
MRGGRAAPTVSCPQRDRKEDRDLKAMVLHRIQPVLAGSSPLRPVELPEPVAADDEVLIRIAACGVCHTELDEIEGRTPPPSLPIILGHQAVGRIVACGRGVDQRLQNERVGVAWIFHACGHCRYCTSGRENLCQQFLATGRDQDGGYAEFMTAPADFVHPIPKSLGDVEAAPLLCAGAIGYRSLSLTNLEDGQSLGLTGFGASGHLVLQLARHRLPRSEIYVFARSQRERAFAVELGATWAGGTDERAPVLLDAIIDTTPAWTPVLRALENLTPGGRLVINAIRKEDSDKTMLAELDYPSHLWLEKEIKSVANVTRADVREFLAAAAEIDLKPQIVRYALAEANQALIDMKTGAAVGAKVLVVD